MKQCNSFIRTNTYTNIFENNPEERVMFVNLFKHLKVLLFHSDANKRLVHSVRRRGLHSKLVEYLQNVTLSSVRTKKMVNLFIKSVEFKFRKEYLFQTDWKKYFLFNKSIFFELTLRIEFLPLLFRKSLSWPVRIKSYTFDPWTVSNVTLSPGHEKERINFEPKTGTSHLI